MLSICIQWLVLTYICVAFKTVFATSSFKAANSESILSERLLHKVRYSVGSAFIECHVTEVVRLLTVGGRFNVVTKL